MDRLLEELLQTPGVPGYEDRVRALIEERLPADLATETDAMGNLVVTLGEGPPALLFVAHMDEIGFVVSDVRDDGFLKLRPLGGIDPRTVFGRALRVVTETGELPGVACVVPVHLMRNREKETSEVPAVTDLLVDVGASSRKEAEALGVKPLDFAVLHKTPLVLNDRLVCARGLDDRAGCYVLLRALERLRNAPLRSKVILAFSVQEEVGLRGAQLLARRHPVERVFAVDSASASDFPLVDRERSPAALGKGPCLRVMDNRAIVPQAYRRELLALAEEAGIPLQVIFSGGGTDAAAFQAEGPHVMPLGFPMRYTHSAVELADLEDVEKTIDLVCAIADRYAGGAR